MLFTAHYVCGPHVCFSMFYVAHCALGIAYVCFMLLTAHYLSLAFAMWYSLFITCWILMFATCCSLFMGCSYPLCGLQFNIRCSHSMYQSQTLYILASFYTINVLKIIILSINSYICSIFNVLSITKCAQGSCCSEVGKNWAQ